MIKKLLILLLVFTFLAPPLKTVFASETETQNQISTPEVQEPAQNSAIVVPVYLIATPEGGALAITKPYENILIWAYATSTESIKVGVITPQGSEFSSQTQTEDDIQQLTPLGVLLVAVYPYHDPNASILGSGEGVGLATTTTYTYATSTAAYLNPHAVATTTAGSSLAYTYDNNGNLLTVRQGTSTPTSTYTWDYNNKLAQAVTTTGGNATSTFSYSPDGQRIKMTVATGTSVTTYYPTKEYNITGSTPTKHIFLPDGTMIATIVGTGTSTTVSYIHTDHLGGMNVATDDSGAVVSLEDMYPYGNTRIDEQNGLSEQRKGISGHEYDPTSGLTYANSRYYNANNAKFISQDPAFLAIGDYYEFGNVTGMRLQEYLSDPQNLNSYSYARNNPIINTDPTGQLTWAEIAPLPSISLPSLGAIGAGISGTIIGIGGALGIGVALSPIGAKHGTDDYDTLTPEQKSAISRQDSDKTKSQDKGQSDTKEWTDKIGQGHSFDKHKGQFPNVKTPEDLAGEADKVVNNPDSIVKEGARGRTAYGDPKKGTVVVHDPNSPDQGTIFKPDKGATRWIKENFK